MKALVTGGSGIVGANLVRALLADGWTVRALVRPGPPRRALAGLPIEVAPGDVLDPRSLSDGVSGIDVVFHAAARFSYDSSQQGEIERVAVEGTRNVVAAAASAKVSRIVLTSSSVVFGSSPSGAADARTEDSQFTPDDASSYAVSKVRQTSAAFSAAAAAARKVELVAVCPTLTVGAWDYGLSESNAIIVKYLNDPFRATFPGGGNIVSARDVARGHILVAKSGMSGCSYLLGAENMNWRELHAEISAICGTHGPLMTASHTTAYLTAAWAEWASRLTGAAPTLTRDEVKMMGRWYWYDDRRARALGYQPGSTRAALHEAIRWLLRTEHIRPDVRAALSVLELAPTTDSAPAAAGAINSVGFA
jgi:dihydroflavonol-4-reductase